MHKPDGECCLLGAVNQAINIDEVHLEAYYDEIPRHKKRSYEIRVMEIAQVILDKYTTQELVDRIGNYDLIINGSRDELLIGKMGPHAYCERLVWRWNDADSTIWEDVKSVVGKLKL